MNSANVLTLYPEIENIGLGVAYDCIMLMDGWEGTCQIKKVHPNGPRFQKHNASIVLGPEAPIRTTPIQNGCLRLRYRDRWGQPYECWYHVTQVKSGAIPSYNIQIDLELPGMTEPNPSFWEMRKFLRNITLYD